MDFSDFAGQTYHSCYDSFSVGPELDGYRLSLSGYVVNSTGGDSLTFGQNWNLNNMKFSTYDKCNDRSVINNCAILHKGGWWWNKCGLAMPTSPYIAGGKVKWEGLNWYYAKMNAYSYKTMKFTMNLK